MQVSYNKYKSSPCIICQNPFFCTYAPITEIWYTLITTEIVFTVKSNSFLHFLLISGLWLLSVALYGKRNKLIMTNWQTIQWKWIIHCNKLWPSYCSHLYSYVYTHGSVVIEYNLAWFLLQIHKIKAYCFAVVFKILVFTLWQLMQ